MIQRPLLWCLAGFVGWFSAGIGCVKINRVSFQTEGIGEIVCKQRRSFSWILIFLGNCVLRFRSVPVQVLSTKKWLQWENELKNSAVGQTVAAHPIDADNGVLVLAKFPGITLADALTRSEIKPYEKIELLGIASQRLFDLHSLSVHCLGSQWLLSHGDATIQNVMIDAQENLDGASDGDSNAAAAVAQWFDFDLRHRYDVSAERRHADDLRAYLFTAACVVAPPDWVDMIVKIRKNYPNERVWDSLTKQIVGRSFRLDVFHFAQMRRATAGKFGESRTLSVEAINQKLIKLILETRNGDVG